MRRRRRREAERTASTPRTVTASTPRQRREQAERHRRAEQQQSARRVRNAVVDEDPMANVATSATAAIPESAVDRRVVERRRGTVEFRTAIDAEHRRAPSPA